MCETSNKEEILFTLYKTETYKKYDAYNTQAGNKEALPSEFHDPWAKVKVKDESREANKFALLFSSNIFFQIYRSLSNCCNKLCESTLPIDTL